LGDKRAARAAVTASKEEAKRKEAYSLNALLVAYVQYQKDNGKADWRKVEAAIARHITEPHPKLAATLADEVTVEAVLPVFDPLTRDRKFTEARKLRAYLRAAYSAAKKARGAAGMHQFRGFAIRSNPLAEFEFDRPSDSADKASAEAAERKWALSEKQLAAYWRRIKADTSSVGAMLRFHLLTGGQRSEQLARLKASDYDPDEKAITLYDTKGRRTKVHLHAVPLIPDALAALETMRGDHGPYLFTTRGGIAPATAHNVWEAVVAVSDAMVKAGEIDRGFTPATIRKTVETRLAACGIPDEVLARLLSHGLGGVQARHYNAHHYNPEKREALNKLRQLCEPKGRATRTSSRRKA
jgi:integrase